jgi:hypothetical protein
MFTSVREFLLALLVISAVVTISEASNAAIQGSPGSGHHLLKKRVTVKLSAGTKVY